MLQTSTAKSALTRGAHLACVGVQGVKSDLSSVHVESGYDRHQGLLCAPVLTNHAKDLALSQRRSYFKPSFDDSRFDPRPRMSAAAADLDVGRISLGADGNALPHRFLDSPGDLRVRLLQPPKLGAEHDEELRR